MKISEKRKRVTGRKRYLRKQQKRKNQNRRNVIIPNEIIIKIFEYFIDDLINIEDCIAEVPRQIGYLHLIILMKNIFLTSKNFNNLFKMCFKERIIEVYDINLKLGGWKSHFWKNLVFSGILNINLNESKWYFYTVDNSYYHHNGPFNHISYYPQRDNLYNLFEKLDIKVFFRLISQFHIPTYDYVTCMSHCTCECT